MIPTVELRLGPPGIAPPLVPVYGREIWSAPLDALMPRPVSAGPVLVGLAARVARSLAGEAMRCEAAPAQRWRVPDPPFCTGTPMPRVDPLVVIVESRPLCVLLARRDLCLPGDERTVLAAYVPTTTAPATVRRVYAAICAATGEPS